MNPVSARIMVLVQIVLFAFCVISIVFVFHALPDSSEMARAAAARAELLQ